MLKALFVCFFAVESPFLTQNETVILALVTSTLLVLIVYGVSRSGVRASRSSERFIKSWLLFLRSIILLLFSMIRLSKVTLILLESGRRVWEAGAPSLLEWRCF